MNTLNLSTGRVMEFDEGFSPLHAVVYSYAVTTSNETREKFFGRGGGEAAIYEFLSEFGLSIEEGERTLACGDWCVLKVQP